LLYHDSITVSQDQTNQCIRYARKRRSNLTIMTPFFLHGKDSRTMQRELSYHDGTFHQHDTSILPRSTGLERRIRIVQPSPFYTSGLLNERPPSWFSSRNFRHPYGSSLSSAEFAHRSLVQDLYASPSARFRTYTHETETYSDGCTKYDSEREPSYSLVRKKMADDVRVKRRSEYLLFVRSKGKKAENGGWRKTEKEVEWVSRRRWM
jgi:hypothetical protein